jgi:GNAT superfamily N-acetyltransferase
MQEMNAEAKVIRPALLGDAEPIAGLLGALGYPASAEEVTARLTSMLGRDDRGVLVADDAAGVIGLAAYQMVTLLERPRPQCRLTTLVVRADQRRRATARSLLDEVEAAAREWDCFRLEVTTRPSREDALAFYVAFGFEQRPHRLIKRLGP